MVTTRHHNGQGPSDNVKAMKTTVPEANTHNCSAYHGHKVCSCGRSSDQVSFARQLLEMQERLTKAEALLGILHTSSADQIQLDNTATKVGGTSTTVEDSYSVKHLTTNAPDSHAKSREVPVHDISIHQDTRPEALAEATDTPSRTKSLPDWPSYVPELFIWPIPKTRARSPEPARARTVVSQAHDNDNDNGSVQSAKLTSLHQIFFELIEPTFPIVYRERFVQEFSNNTRTDPVYALSYAIALVATTVSPEHAHLQTQYYESARLYLDRCERSLTHSGFTNIDTFQALLFVARFEIIDSQISKAWMTLERAVRLSNLLKLHQMDSPERPRSFHSDLGKSLPLMKDPLLEERRRSFWALFILDSYASNRSGLACRLDSSWSCEVKLPSPGTLTHSFSQRETMPFLRNVHQSTADAALSSYANCILLMDLALRCFVHQRQRIIRKDEQGFWDSHFMLDKLISQQKAAILRQPVTQAIIHDPISLATCLNLYATEISFHQRAVQQTEVLGVRVVTPSMITESKNRALTAAYEIANIVRTVLALPHKGNKLFTIQAPFVTWALVTAMTVLKSDALSLKEQDILQATGDIWLLFYTIEEIEQKEGRWRSKLKEISTDLDRWVLSKNSPLVGFA